MTEQMEETMLEETPPAALEAMPRALLTRQDIEGMGISTIGLTDDDCTIPCWDCGIEAFRHHDALDHVWRDPR